jgi:hypothetical protein
VAPPSSLLERVSEFENTRTRPSAFSVVVMSTECPMAPWLSYTSARISSSSFGENVRAVVGGALTASPSSGMVPMVGTFPADAAESRTPLMPSGSLAKSGTTRS